MVEIISGGEYNINGKRYSSVGELQAAILDSLQGNNEQLNAFIELVRSSSESDSNNLDQILAAINSLKEDDEMTDEVKNKLDQIASQIQDIYNSKQDALSAGEGLSIENGVISLLPREEDDVMSEELKKKILEVSRLTKELERVKQSSDELRVDKTRQEAELNRLQRSNDSLRADNRQIAIELASMRRQWQELKDKIDNQSQEESFVYFDNKDYQASYTDLLTKYEEVKKQLQDARYELSTAQYKFDTSICDKCTKRLKLDFFVDRYGEVVFKDGSEDMLIWNEQERTYIPIKYFFTKHNIKVK